MSCEACQNLLIVDCAAAHEGLRIYCNRSVLRPLGRPPIIIDRYRCKHCGDTWMRETDPVRQKSVEWICLYQTSNILTPPVADQYSSVSSISQSLGVSGGAAQRLMRFKHWRRRLS
jgi:transposase-like protein